jgi:hypothetical protein
MTSTMTAFVLPKWAKSNDLTQHWKLYHDFPAKTELLTRQVGRLDKIGGRGTYSMAISTLASRR